MEAILHFIFVVLVNIFMFFMLLGLLYWAFIIVFYIPYAAAKGKLGRVRWL